MVASCALFSLLGAMGRYLASEVHPFQIVFFRLLFSLLCLLPWVLWRGLGVLRTDKLRLYGLRSLVSLGSMITWFYAMALLPIAEVTALNFLSPLFATAGAALFLRETVGARRWAATLIGFAGALVIIRPGMMAMSAGSWLALASAVFMGISILMIRTLARTEHPNAVVFYMGAFMTPLALIPAIVVWQTPSLEMWLWLIATGPVATLGHLALVRAVAAAEASAVAPFDFSKLPFAAVIGYVAFGEAPDLWTWVGAGVIFAAATYVVRREARLARAKAAPAATQDAGPGGLP
jgi:drug/metabolite transporter (DMT)-like permease